MMIGPAPMIMIVAMSVRFGINRVLQIRVPSSAGRARVS